MSALKCMLVVYFSLLPFIASGKKKKKECKGGGCIRKLSKLSKVTQLLTEPETQILFPLV